MKLSSATNLSSVMDSTKQTYYIKITDFDDNINSKGDDNNG
jgi:hypothetical protein